MADDPFPTNGDTRVPTSIGDTEWRFVFLVDGNPYAHYSVQILDQVGAVMDAEARTAINSILSVLETFGLVATS